MPSESPNTSKFPNILSSLFPQSFSCGTNLSLFTSHANDRISHPEVTTPTHTHSPDITVDNQRAPARRLSNLSTDERHCDQNASYSTYSLQEAEANVSEKSEASELTTELEVPVTNDKKIGTSSCQTPLRKARLYSSLEPMQESEEASGQVARDATTSKTSPSKKVQRRILPARLRGVSMLLAGSTLEEELAGVEHKADDTPTLHPDTLIVLSNHPALIAESYESRDHCSTQGNPERPSSNGAGFQSEIETPDFRFRDDSEVIGKTRGIGQRCSEDTSDAVYERRHRKPENAEKRQKKLEKAALEGERQRLKERIVQLKQADVRILTPIVAAREQQRASHDQTPSTSTPATVTTKDSATQLYQLEDLRQELLKEASETLKRYDLLLTEPSVHAMERKRRRVTLSASEHDHNSTDESGSDTNSLTRTLSLRSANSKEAPRNHMYSASVPTNMSSHTKTKTGIHTTHNNFKSPFIREWSEDHEHALGDSHTSLKGEEQIVRTEHEHKYGSRTRRTNTLQRTPSNFDVHNKTDQNPNLCHSDGLPNGGISARNEIQNNHKTLSRIERNHLFGPPSAMPDHARHAHKTGPSLAEIHAQECRPRRVKLIIKRPHTASISSQDMCFEQNPLNSTNSTNFCSETLRALSPSTSVEARNDVKKENVVDEEWKCTAHTPSELSMAQAEAMLEAAMTQTGDLSAAQNSDAPEISVSLTTNYSTEGDTGDSQASGIIDFPKPLDPAASASLETTPIPPSVASNQNVIQTCQYPDQIITSHIKDAPPRIARRNSSRVKATSAFGEKVPYITSQRQDFDIIFNELLTTPDWQVYACDTISDAEMFDTETAQVHAGL